jgi:hypothetical protein
MEEAGTQLLPQYKWTGTIDVPDSVNVAPGTQNNDKVAGLITSVWNQAIKDSQLIAKLQSQVSSLKDRVSGLSKELVRVSKERVIRSEDDLTAAAHSRS